MEQVISALVGGALWLTSALVWSYFQHYLATRNNKLIEITIINAPVSRSWVPLDKILVLIKNIGRTTVLTTDFAESLILIFPEKRFSTRKQFLERFPDEIFYWDVIEHQGDNWCIFEKNYKEHEALRHNITISSKPNFIEIFPFSLIPGKAYTVSIANHNMKMNENELDIKWCFSEIPEKGNIHRIHINNI